MCEEVCAQPIRCICKLSSLRGVRCRRSAQVYTFTISGKGV